MLIDNIDVRTEAECWRWLAKKLPSGYGTVFIGKKRFVYAHRAVFSILFGTIPFELVMRHKCDNRPCVNPFHLEPGTAADNIHDAIKRGRSRPAFGENTGSHKLLCSQIPEIRTLKAAGMPTQEIATRFGVSFTSIHQVIKGQTWKHVK